ncbi:MAG: DUF503 domain-containing protein [Clostridiales bacterium]|nr:DUF503 domain-containing protein [Clostridiales bacterium]
MIIGLLSLEIFLPASHSLKEKRKVISAFRDRIRKKFNVAVAELDFLDKWQRAKIGIVTINNQQGLVDQVLRRITEEAEQNLEAEVLKAEIHYF